MPTSPITKEFVLKDDEAAKRLLKVLTEEPTRKVEDKHAYEKGKEKLKQLRWR